MGWARFDDRRAMNRKLREAGFAAAGLDAAAICQVTADMTDGHISRSTVEMLAAAYGERRWQRLVDVLVKVGRWEVNGTGWYIHDYLEFNPSRAERQALLAERAASGRAGGLAKARAKARAVAPANELANDLAVPSRPVPKGKTSSSSNSRPSPKPDEEEDDLYAKEAKRRLAATPTLVTNPTAWLAATVRGLRDEGWIPTLATRPDEPRLVLRDDRKPCENCSSSGVVLNAGGFAEKCPDCNG